jgi:mono/diheme cytochrome c family protein
MKRIIPFLFLMSVVSLSLFASQEPKPEEKTGQDAVPMPAPYRIPEEDAKTQNPIKYTASSVAEGRRLYDSQCAMCHGETGDGKGELAVSLTLTTIKDWTQPDTLKDWTDGQIFYVMDKGKRHMPGQEGRMKADQKWHLVNLIRALTKKEAKDKEAKKP